MSTLYTLIKNDRAFARKDGNKRSAAILTFILGELQRLPAKDCSDEIVIRTLQKIYNNLETSLSLAYTDDKHFELCVVSKYLPRKITDFELNELIKEIVEVHPELHMGQIMSLLKSVSNSNRMDKPRFTYDGKVAAKFVKEVISNG